MGEPCASIRHGEAVPQATGDRAVSPISSARPGDTTPAAGSLPGHSLCPRCSGLPDPRQSQETLGQMRGKVLQPLQAECGHQDPRGRFDSKLLQLPAQKTLVTGWTAGIPGFKGFGGVEFKMQKLHLSSPEHWGSTNQGHTPRASVRNGPAIWAPSGGGSWRSSCWGGLGREAQSRAKTRVLTTSLKDCFK